MPTITPWAPPWAMRFCSPGPKPPIWALQLPPENSRMVGWGWLGLGVLRPLGMGAVPVQSVPMRLPNTRTFGNAAGPLPDPSWIAESSLPEITLRAPGVVPPMTTSRKLTMSMP